MIIGFETNDLDIFKVHTMAGKVNMACNLALTITKDRLQRDQNLAERSYLSVDNILKLSDSVLGSTTITLNMMAITTNRYLDVPWVLPLLLF